MWKRSMMCASRSYVHSSAASGKGACFRCAMSSIPSTGIKTPSADGSARHPGRASARIRVFQGDVASAVAGNLGRVASTT